MGDGSGSAFSYKDGLIGDEPLVKDGIFQVTFLDWDEKWRHKLTL